jgi:hypothetical protein
MGEAEFKELGGTDNREAHILGESSRFSNLPGRRFDMESRDQIVVQTIAQLAKFNARPFV